jgi:hypothetical protein
MFQFMAQKLQTSAVIITLLTVFSGEALTEVRPNQIGSFKDWLVYSFDGDKSKVCYASSTPKASEPKNAKRDPAFLYVTSMPDEKPPVKGEVSTMMGYPLKDGQAVKLTIDGERFGMFTVGNTAWVNPGSDKKAVAAMKAGETLQVEGTSLRGTRTVDTYSLDGFSDALAAVDKACN